MPVASYAFIRRLGRFRRDGGLHQFIVDAMAKAVSADLGTLAINDDDGKLRIVATHGYPLVLVDDLRIPAGVGTIGGVFRSRRATIAAGGDRRQHPPRRRRYRTSSYIGVPLLVGFEAIGVVTLGDPSAADTFTRADLSTARAMAAAAGIALSREQLREHAREVARTAGLDPLTTLFNRIHFESRLAEEAQRATRYGSNMALLLVDVDDLKAVNDTLGHTAGDDVLRRIAAILKRSVRVFDVCVRYGGDEFAILMPGTTIENAVATGERIRSRVEREPMARTLRAPARRTTVTVGVSAFVPGVSVAAWLDAADQALYEAKRSGKNRVHLAAT